VGLAAIALGGVAFLLGRTGSPLCDPASVFQWHALWHVLVAAALVAYAYAIAGRRDERSARDPERVTQRPVELDQLEG
jgi:hypothetical protein